MVRLTKHKTPNTHTHLSVVAWVITSDAKIGRARERDRETEGEMLV